MRRRIALGATAGTFNLLHPEPAPDLGECKAKAMVTAGHGCRVQVATTLARLGGQMPLAHAVQIGSAVTHAVPQTTTVPTRGAAPSSPVS